MKITVDALVSQCLWVKAAPCDPNFCCSCVKHYDNHNKNPKAFTFPLHFFSIHMCKFCIVVYHNCSPCCYIIITIITLMAM